jgi:DNA-binding response OmpR family regulator
MDIQMPDVDGIAATEHIRALPHPARDVPIIAVTANIRPEKVMLFQKAGMNDHIGKPFKREAPVRLVQHWLNQPSRNVPASDPAHNASMRQATGPRWRPSVGLACSSCSTAWPNGFGISSRRSGAGRLES